MGAGVRDIQEPDLELEDMMKRSSEPLITTSSYSFFGLIAVDLVTVSIRMCSDACVRVYAYAHM